MALEKLFNRVPKVYGGFAANLSGKRTEKRTRGMRESLSLLYCL